MRPSLQTREVHMNTASNTVEYTTKLTFAKKASLKENNKKKITKIGKKKPTYSKKKTKTFSYTVKQGDSLFHISKKFNNRVSTLISLNGDLSQTLKVGKILTIKR